MKYWASPQISCVPCHPVKVDCSWHPEESTVDDLRRQRGEDEDFDVVEVRQDGTQIPFVAIDNFVSLLMSMSALSPFVTWVTVTRVL